MKKLKVIFMGTPEFSVPVLGALIKHTNVIMVVTTPDAKVGRKQVLTESPVKIFAKENNIPVKSPFNIADISGDIINSNADIIITCAYGQIIKENLLNFPKYGCVNIHASLLPKYRGGAPVHHAIMNGDSETGITIMYMDSGMDSGDIIEMKSVKINSLDNIDTLSSKLSILGSKMIIEQLPLIINGQNKRKQQNLEQVTYAPIIKRVHEKIDFNKTSLEVYNLFKALYPQPLPYFTVDNDEYKIVKCEIVNGEGCPGQIISVDKTGIVIMCKENAIKITKLKPKGKKIMEVKDFLNGNNFGSHIDKKVQ